VGTWACPKLGPEREASLKNYEISIQRREVLETQVRIFPMTNITRPSTSEEIANPDSITREHVLKRLSDWHERVHELYDAIERAFQNTDFKLSREAKLQHPEELPQRFGITEADQPKIEILHILRPEKSEAAALYPRGLWIIGANGRVDLRITSPMKVAETYMIVDQSAPFARPTQWIRIPVDSPFDREPFDPRWLVARLN
jgi:hypothetical protein